MNLLGARYIAAAAAAWVVLRAAFDLDGPLTGLLLLFGLAALGTALGRVRQAGVFVFGAGTWMAAKSLIALLGGRHDLASLAGVADVLSASALIVCGLVLMRGARASGPTNAS
jgi:hypothetical protein